jgi:hypothetical protein
MGTCGRLQWMQPARSIEAESLTLLAWLMRSAIEVHAPASCHPDFPGFAGMNPFSKHATAVHDFGTHQSQGARMSSNATRPSNAIQGDLIMRFNRLSMQSHVFSALIGVCIAGSPLAHAGTVTSMDVINSGTSAWLIDGVANPALTMIRGQTYEFLLQNTPPNHPFNINTINTTGSANRYGDGVTNNGATGTATITFVVPLAAPDSLHYNCGNHPGMNGPITILNDSIFAASFE